MLVSDIDGVLCDTSELAVQYACHHLNHDYRTLPTENLDYERGLINRFPAELRAEAERLIRDAFDNNEGDIYRNAPVRTYAHEVLHELNDAGLLRGYVTRRPPVPEVIAATRDWIEENRFPDLPIEHAPKGISKAVYMRRLAADLIVEDSPGEIANIRENGLEAIVMDHPYNRAVAHPHMRLNCWSGILPLVRVLRTRAS